MLEVIWPELEWRLDKGLQGWTRLWTNILRYTLHAGFAGDPHLEPVVSALVGDGIHHGWRSGAN